MHETGVTERKSSLGKSELQTVRGPKISLMMLKNSHCCYGLQIRPFMCYRNGLEIAAARRIAICQLRTPLRATCVDGRLETCRLVAWRCMRLTSAVLLFNED